MNCGAGLPSPTSDSLNDLFSFIGLGNKKQPSTPSTVGLKDDDDNSTTLHEDDEDIGDDGTLGAIRQLNYAPCLPAGCTPAGAANGARLVVQFTRCNPTTCKMISGMCVDCAYCLNHCVCGDSENAGFLPAVCGKAPDCSPVVCGDCLRCENHCVCHCSTDRNNRNAAKMPQRTTVAANRRTLTAISLLSIETDEHTRESETSGHFTGTHRGTTTSPKSKGQPNRMREQQLEEEPCSPETLRASMSLLSTSTKSSDCNDDGTMETFTTGRSTMNSSVNNSTVASVNGGSTISGNHRRYNMGNNDGEYNDNIYLTHRMLEQHRRRSIASSGSSVGSYNSNASSSQHTGGSSSHRYKCGRSDGGGGGKSYDDQSYNHRSTGSHRRCNSSASTSSNRSACSSSAVSVASIASGSFDHNYSSNQLEVYDQFAMLQGKKKNRHGHQRSNSQSSPDGTDSTRTSSNSSTSVAQQEGVYDKDNTNSSRTKRTNNRTSDLSRQQAATGKSSKKWFLRRS